VDGGERLVGAAAVSAATRVPTSRSGFTVIEVMIAVVIMGLITLGLMSFTGMQLKGTSGNATRLIASTVAESHMALIKSDPAYGTVATRRGGTVTGFSGYSNMTRTTTFTRVQRTAVPRADYYIVTISVTEPSMANPITITSVVKQP
jgi:prepilin-type N-terminal cleavage/methylation domain-containing protein